MPTIDIPDRICPHCGGIRWKTEHRKKPTKANPNKRVIRYRCSIKGQERYNKWQKNNSERCKEHSIAKNKRLKEICYHKTPKERERARLKSKKESDTLAINFIYRTILKSFNIDGIKRSDIPQKLIDRKREQLLLTRQLKQLEK